MTLVVSMAVHSNFVMFGDLMLSGPESEQSLDLPNLGGVSQYFPEGSYWVPTQLRQKLTIINDNFIVGWSGDYISARYLLTEFKNSLSDNQYVGPNAFMEFLQKDESRAKDNVQFLYIGCSGRGDDGAHLYKGSYSAQCFRDPELGLVFAIGSGSDDFLQIAKNVPPPNYGSLFADIPGARSVLTAYNYMSQLNANEVNNSRNLYSFYGGGYEVACWDGDRFEKSRETTYLNWNLFLGETNKLVFSGVITKHKYLDNHLLIYSVRLNFKGLRKGYEVLRKYWAVPSVLGSKSPPELSGEEDASSTLTCTNIHTLNEATKEYGVVNLIHTAQQSKDCFSLCIESRNTTLSFSNNYLQSVTDAIRDLTKRKVEYFLNG